MRRPQSPALFTAAAVALLIGGCRRKDDEPLPPPAPPELSVVELRPAGGDAAEIDAPCVEIGADADGTLIVALANAGTTSVGEWLLRPPGTCGSVAACGFLRTVVEADLGEAPVEVLAATAAIPVPLAQIFGGEGGAGGAGVDRATVTITVTLLNDDGFPVRTAAGDRVETSFTVALSRPGSCTSSGEGGAAGAPPDGTGGAAAGASGAPAPAAGASGASREAGGEAATTAGAGGAAAGTAGSRR